MVARLQSNGELRRFDRRSEQLRHRRVKASAAPALAGWASKRGMEPGTAIHRAAPIGPRAYRQATTAAPTPSHALHQGAAFAPCSPRLGGGQRASVVELLLLAATLGPADRARVIILQDCRPRVAFALARGALDTRRFAGQRALPGCRTSIDVGSGGKRVVQDRQPPGLAQRTPDPCTCALAPPPPLRNLHPVICTGFHHPSGRLRAGKDLEDSAHRVPDFLIGIEPNRPRRLRDEAHGSPKAQGAVRRLFPRAAAQPAVPPVECRVAHRASESSEQSLLVLPRIIAAIFVDPQGGGPGAACHQAIPGAAGAGQARRCSTQHGSGPPQADFGDELCNPIATAAGSAGAAVLVVHDDHERFRPSQVGSALRPVVLAGGPGGVVADLAEGRLAYGDESGTGQVLVAELGRGEGGSRLARLLRRFRVRFDHVAGHLGNHRDGLLPEIDVALPPHLSRAGPRWNTSGRHRQTSPSPVTTDDQLLPWGRVRRAARAWGAATALGKPLLLAQWVQELQELAQSLEGSAGEGGGALRR
jgi:hypothetical protein